MKKTQLLDACRNIQKEFVAWLSITIIGLLATVSFLGISYSAATLRKDALHFYNSHGLWDIELSSTALLDEGDLPAVRALPGVAEAEPVWQVDGKLRVGGADTFVTVMSLPETISRPELLEGRLPSTAGECAVEKELMDRCGYAVGQRISPEVKPISGIEPLPETDYVITGVFRTPDHITYMVPVTPYMLVTKDSFNLEGLDGAFMKLRVRVEGAPENRYSDAYRNTVKAVEDAIGGISAERAALRTDRLRSAYDEDIEQAQKELGEAAEQIRGAREKLADAQRELEEAEETLRQALEKLTEGAALLKDGKEELLEGQEALKEGKTKLDNFENYLNSGTASAANWPSDIGFSYQEYWLLHYMMHISNAEIMDLIYEMSGYNKYERDLKQAEAELEAARLKWYDSGEEYLDGVTRFEKAQKELGAGERDLAQAMADYEEGRQTLADALELRDRIEDGHWVVFNNKSNLGYIYADENVVKLKGLSMSFSSIFLIVGALVIYATIGRMVEQHRSLIGTIKAMGLYNREIFVKYLFFACTAVLLGVGLGVLLAWLPLQRTILESYEKLLCYGTGTRSFLPLETTLVVVGAVTISVVAVYLGCGRLLRVPAIQLIQNAVLGGGAQKKARRSAQRSLFYRLVLRNMRTDLARVLVTIVSIAGGCALMVIGFTLRYGISGVPDRQFGGILTYEAEIFYDLSENPDAAAEIEAILAENALPHIDIRKEDSIFEADGALNATTLIVAEKGSLEGYYALDDINGGGRLELPDSGALVPRRFWEFYNFDVGEDVPVYDPGMALDRLRIAGVFENYYGQLFFLTPQSYEEAFGSAAEPNCFFVKTEGMPLHTLRQKLADVEGLVKVDDAAADRDVIEQFNSSLNLVVWIMLFIAGMMACFIVANFTLTYIQRKTRELTIMRINGFSAGECIRYLALDLVVTTLLGTLIGLVVGRYIGSSVLSTTETEYIQMIRSLDPRTYLYSTLITCGFSALTNGVALQKVRKLKLSDLG